MSCPATPTLSLAVWWAHQTGLWFCRFTQVFCPVSASFGCLFSTQHLPFPEQEGGSGQWGYKHAWFFPPLQTKLQYLLSIYIPPVCAAAPSPSLLLCPESQPNGTPSQECESQSQRLLAATPSLSCFACDPPGLLGAAKTRVHRDWCI